MKTEKIVAVKDEQMHAYDDTQRETAYLAKSDKRPGYRWYVGFGGDYRPATKSDLQNITPYTSHEAAGWLIGATVHARVDCD